MIRIEVWGDKACFTRPEFKVERISYDVITPSAARGILDCVYWHPAVKRRNNMEDRYLLRSEIGNEI